MQCCLFCYCQQGADVNKLTIDRTTRGYAMPNTVG